ncbi:protein cordon-bleu-like isoform X2 [Bombus vosnesenskii]|uniref:Protein cordon-bleu-like isoform X2 n=1 Tax=Bombus vosnesenskii TaxID=207650 RepID=A0A6J3LN23_9HYME|nr:protein cordon-bleu-like isoform X2 [Bombus vosnesenskii]
MLCLKKRRTYSFTQGVCTELPRRSKEDNHRYEGSLNMAITTLPRKNRIREERPSRMVLTVTEDTPADMLAGSMELLVQLPQEHHLQTQRVTVQRNMPMMDLLVQIATAHKLTASSYTLQAIGERGIVLPHQPNTPIGALDALQVKLLPKQGTFVPRKSKQVNQPFETTFRLQVHLPRNQLWVSRVSPKMNLGEILDQVCREKDLDKNKYELRHPASLETLDLSLSLQDYHLQEVTLYAKQGRSLGSALSTQDIMALQRQEERRRQQAKQGVFGFVFKKSKEGSLSTDSLGGRSASPARSDETGRSTSPLQPPTRPQRKRRPAPKPPIQAQADVSNGTDENCADSSKDKVVISHSRNSSDSSGYHEASVLSDNPDSAGRLPETLPRRNKVPLEMPRKLAQTSQSSKSLSNLTSVPGLRKKRVAPPPPVTRPLSSAISTQALERIVDSEESLTSDMDPSKPPSDISVPSKANSDIEERPKASSDIGVTTLGSKLSNSIDFTNPDSSKVELELKGSKCDIEPRHRSGSINVKLPSMEPGHPAPVEDAPVDSRLPRKRVGEPVPLPKPRKAATIRPEVPKRKLKPPSPLSRTLSSDSSYVDSLSNAPAHSSTGSFITDSSSNCGSSIKGEEKLDVCSNYSTSEDEVFMTPGHLSEASFDYSSIDLEEKNQTNSTDTALNNDIDDGANGERKLSINEDKVNEASLNQDSTMVRSELSTVSSKNSSQEKKLCAVISTMPKCDHLSSLSIKDTVSQSKEWEGLKEPKKARIPRTASKSNDFEVNALEKQKRHLTSHAEDITFALNLNVNPSLLSDRDLAQQSREEQDTESQDVGGEKSPVAVVSSDTNLSETDVLLQKVSDTLTNSLPVASFDEVPVSPTITKLEPTNISKETDQKNKKISEYPNGFDVNISSTNLTVNSQQDTSDYVSAVDEDLSVTDWEYQLPAPPSAFRDSASPVFDNFEVITPSPESFRDTEITELTSTSDQKDERNIIEKVERQEIEVRKETPLAKSFIQQKPESSMKKEVIYELENKISTLPQNNMSQKDVDSRRLLNPSTPKISPVDNTLSNFTITTYSKQKNLNIFEEVEQSRKINSDERFIKSFATLTRNKGNLDESEDKNLKEFSVGTLQGKRKVTMGEDKSSETKLEPKIQTESLQRWQSGNEKSNIQRSKSYISMCDKSNLQGNICEIESIKNEKNLEMDDSGMKKATSISNLSVTATKNDEKSSQWRDNILKRPTKEKQLQSVQVLKSILPQLKNAQQAEENVPKDSSDIVLSEKTRSETTSNEHSIESNEVSTREPQTAPSNKKVEPESKKPTPETNKKRYTYSGPPMINLGSWSERPSINVQIKKDIDYKFGVKQTNSTTIVNINSSKDEVDSNNVDSSTKIQKSKFEFLDKKEPNELTKKLISHTTATGFKKLVLNKVNNSEPKVTNDKPVVTGVELKKSFLENKQDDNVIDTTPVNFKELTKAFGQDVCLRPKPKRSSTIQRSDSQLENDSSRQNGHRQDQCLINGHQNIKPKRYSSIVGIQNEGNLTFRNGLSIKGHQPMPVVKGFKMSSTKIGASQSYENQTKEGFKEEMKEDNIKGSSKDSNGTPRPPTMPVITGVTLKSARPKSMPIQIDQRDVLLESIRNFGGRENLKSAMERC